MKVKLRNGSTGNVQKTVGALIVLLNHLKIFSTMAY